MLGWNKMGCISLKIIQKILNALSTNLKKINLQTFHLQIRVHLVLQIMDSHHAVACNQMKNYNLDTESSFSIVNPDIVNLDILGKGKIILQSSNNI